MPASKYVRPTVWIPPAVSAVLQPQPPLAPSIPPVHAVDTRVLEEVAELTVRGAGAMLLRERFRAVPIAAVDADELAAVGRGHRRRDLDVWMLARADDAPSERHEFSSGQAGRFALRNVRTCRTASGIFSFVSFHGKKVSSDFGASIADSMACS